MRKESNSLGTAFKLLKYVWDHRKANKVPALVNDTIEVLYKGDVKPKVIKKIKKENGYTFIIHLPPGISYSELKDKEQYFADSTGGAVQIEKHGKAVFIEVMTDELKSKYPFVWN